MSKNEETTIQLPAIPLNQVVAYPNVSITIEITRPFSKIALSVAEEMDSYVFLIPQPDATKDSITKKNLSPIGTICAIRKIVKTKKDTIIATFEGIARASLEEIGLQGNYYLADVVKRSDIYSTERDESFETACRRNITERATRLIQMIVNKPDYERKIFTTKDLSFLIDACAQTVIIDNDERISLLNELGLYERATMLISIFDHEIQVAKWEEELQKATSERMEENQKEFFLREQMKVLQSELGSDGEDDDDIVTRIQKENLPENVREKLLKEAKKYNKLPFGSQEGALILSYIEACLEIPFGKYSKTSCNVESAKKILEKDHYGLEKIKERILEYIAIKQLSPNIKGQVICFVGPPGVGKTSLCASIAKALNRNYVRVSLGGVRDEADIRGHRKTYLGSMPGRIINALTEAKTMNPLIVLDEIDKMSSDQRGDPASAVLEVLDTEQNQKFRDHFIEMEIDLSSCMFIATANSLSDIPEPLRDRMDVIELSSYTREEKFHIAKNHLLPKQIEKNGLTKKAVKFEDDVLYSLIDHYTAEAGVRSLERVIASLIRKGAKEMLGEDGKIIKITLENLEKLLGPQKYETEKIEKQDEVGIVNGMAYTSIGGDLLKIESCVMKGTGKVQLTGKLGDVMKESAEIAISFLREHAEILGISPDFYQNNDIHIHVPEGAVSKDGPSAGVTIATSLYSTLSGRKVRKDVSMTGEITLHGKVLPIGGLKEKSIAAYTGGVTEILIPEGNEKDLYEIDPLIRSQVKFTPCKTLFDVFSVAMLPASAEVVRFAEQYVGV